MPTARITKTTTTTHPRKRCNKCQGTGFIKHFRWNAHGRCFACGGQGHVPDRSRQVVETEIVISSNATLEVSVAEPESQKKERKADCSLAGLSWSEQAYIRACQKA